jgi:pilus assembly protein CpaB
MNNIRKFAIVTVVAGIVGLLVAFGTYRKNQLAHDAYIRSQHLFRYVAASKPIQAGQKITDDDLMIVNWTSDQPVVGAFLEKEKSKLIDRVAIYPIADGMVITEKYLAGPDSFLGLAQKIPTGMRAVAIKTDEVSDLGGFLFPGSKVDIMAVLHAVANRDPRTVNVAQNVPVIATGKQMTPDPSGKATAVTVVTVLVNPSDAQKIALAQQQGSIYFALRNGADQSVNGDKSSDFSLASDTQVSTQPAKRNRSTRTMGRKHLGAIPEFPSPPSTVVTILGDQTQISQQFRGGLPVAPPVSRPGAAAAHSQQQQKENQ